MSNFEDSTVNVRIIESVLSRDQLDSLLFDARNCLGLPTTPSGDKIEEEFRFQESFESSEEAGLTQNV